MTNTFLSDLSEGLLASRIAMEDTVVVLPNRRAHRMLLKQLVAKCDRPLFSPAIFTIEEFVENLSPMRKMDQLEALVALFQVFQSFNTTDAHDFDAFLAWGPSFLDDVSDMDVQLQNCVSIFQDLSTTKTFEISFGQDEVSPGQRKILQFYDLLSELYLKFVDSLKVSKCGYAGLLYRDCAENMDQYAQQLPYKHYVFAGFHVLSASELKIVRYFKDHFDTHFFFDIDTFYCDFQKDDNLTTAYFLRKICQELSILPEKMHFVNHFFETKAKNIQIVGTSKSMNQIYYAIDQLEKIRKQQDGNLDDTVLVLADESLLLPLLSAYNPKDMNVTMGYSFKATPAYTLLETLLEMYQTGLRYKHDADINAPMAFYHRDIIALMRNPLVKSNLFKGADLVGHVIEKYDNSQSYQYYAKDIEEFELPDYTLNTNKMLPATVDFLVKIMDLSMLESHRAMLSVLVEKLSDLDAFLQPLLRDDFKLSFSTLKYLVGQQISNLSLSMKGDNTKGLQVMGLLETRTLDFKNVIMLSVNEGTLPSGITYNSLLPFDLKYQGQALENYLYKDQVYAYHFFRLIQRADNVVLLYNNDTMGNLAEKSRFVTQLEYEVKERNLSNIHLNYPVVSFPFKPDLANRIVVEKNDAIRQAILDFEFSATAINDYISCPLSFYLKNICGIRKPTTFNDKIEHNVIGTATHWIFEQLFNEIKAVQEKGGHYADYKHLFEDYKKNIDTIVTDSLKAIEQMDLKERDMQFGRLYLATQIVKQNVVNYLESAPKEMSGDLVRILGCEMKVKGDIVVDGRCMHLKGSIDRLQSQGDRLMVVDYKTGKVDDAKLGLLFEGSHVEESSDFDLRKYLEAHPLTEAIIREHEYYQVVQLLFYALLCRYDAQVEVDKMKIVCGLLSTMAVNKGEGNSFFPVRMGVEKESLTELIDDVYLNVFESQIKKLLSEIYSQETFEQCEDSSHCAYCDFKFICCR